MVCSGQRCSTASEMGRTPWMMNSPARWRLTRLVSSACHCWNAAFRVVTRSTCGVAAMTVLETVQEGFHLWAGDLGAVAGAEDQAADRDVLGWVEGDEPAVRRFLTLDVGG